MRVRPQPAHANHERWLVSYADFITLLFAFFVVMFASTQADKNKFRAVSESVREALEHGQFSSAISTVLGRGKHDASKPPLNAERVPHSENEPPPPASSGDLSKTLNTLQTGLEQELQAGKVRIKLDSRGLVISLREAAFFASGDDTVATASYPILQKIADVLRELPQALRIEGHTDSRRIHNSRFRSNWELSAARAIAMMQVLSDQYAIPSERMAVAGYADHVPDDSNDTEEGRAHNRRVDLVVLSAQGLRGEPQASPFLPPAAAVRSQQP